MRSCPPPLARLERFDDDIHALDEFFEEFPAVGGFDVQSDTLFIGVEVPPIKAPLTVRDVVIEGAIVPHGVPPGVFRS